MVNKKCSKCNLEKTLDCFHKSKQFKSGYYSSCKPCRKIESARQYLADTDNKKIKSMEYYKKNQKRISKRNNEWSKKRCKTDPKYLLARRLRNRLWYALKQKYWKKNTKFTEYIGCDLEFLKMHIEMQFVDGMSWENQGDWHIDHIIPLVSAKTEEELYLLCHFRNLKPMWAKENLSKGPKIQKDPK